MMTDPIADMLSRIRNANNARHKSVDVPCSNIKKEIAKILLDEGYIKGLSLIHISEPTRPCGTSRMPSSA